MTRLKRSCSSSLPSPSLSLFPLYHSLTNTTTLLPSLPLLSLSLFCFCNTLSLQHSYLLSQSCCPFVYHPSLPNTKYTHRLIYTYIHTPTHTSHYQFWASVKPNCIIVCPIVPQSTRNPIKPSLIIFISGPGSFKLARASLIMLHTAAI